MLTKEARKQLIEQCQTVIPHLTEEQADSLFEVVKGLQQETGFPAFAFKNKKTGKLKLSPVKLKRSIIEPHLAALESLYAGEWEIVEVMVVPK